MPGGIRCLRVREVFQGWSRNHHIHRPKSTITNSIALMPVQSTQSRTEKKYNSVTEEARRPVEANS